ncbi:hypothetical protein KR067_003288 [Drosophila pandora]|nr:hypothetical protein KR067_003288 [Drosophila pandora]
MAIMAANSSAGLLDKPISSIKTKFLKQEPTKDGYRIASEKTNGGKREEMGVIMNSGTPDKQMGLMGTYSSFGEKTDTDNATIYTADMTRYELKNRTLSGGSLKSLSG